MNEMLERVKQTIVASQGKSPDAMARAILAAMREPTELIENAAKPYVAADYRSAVWTAMIDAALQDPPKKESRLSVVTSP